MLKLLGLEGLLKLWREFEPTREGPEYDFLDEIQMARDWQTWLKHQVDFEKRRRIAVTGSATPLVTEGQESGVGRWQTIRLATLSFYEYLQLRKLAVPALPAFFLLILPSAEHCPLNNTKSNRVLQPNFWGLAIDAKRHPDRSRRPTEL